MFKLSTYIAKLEDRWGKKLGRLWEKHKGKWKLYLPLGLSGWYFYGMLINSIRLGTRATFNQTGADRPHRLHQRIGPDIAGKAKGRPR